MTYKEALKYLSLLKRKEIKFGLGRIKQVLKELGKPQDKFSVIHIAGTNGKGSVASFIYSVLQEAGYKVGIYLSPHLIDLRERIQINGKWISKEEIVNLTEKIANISEHLIIELTYFEFLTIIAFFYFAKQKTDFAIIEVGMGGRLDATNAIKSSLVSIITNIDYEHKNYLGNTLSKIAYEKAGIIKDGGFVITGTKHKSAFIQIRKICQKKKANLFSLGKDFLAVESKKKLSVAKKNSFYQEFNYQGIINDYEGLKIQLLGKHQIENASLSLGCIEILQFFYGVFITKKHIRKGLYRSFWPGRFEILEVPIFNSHRVRVLLDGAHNPSSFRMLQRTLRDKVISYRKLFVLFGVLVDKDVRKILKILLPLVDKFVISRPATERALAPEAIYSWVIKFLPKERVILGGRVLEDIKRIFREVLLWSKPCEQGESRFKKIKEEALILVTGSLYLVGEVKKILVENKEVQAKDGRCYF